MLDILEMVNARAFKSFAIVFSILKNLLVGISGALNLLVGISGALGTQ